MHAYRIADWTGDIRAVSWSSRGRDARPHGVRLEHGGGNGQPRVWFETHRKQHEPRGLARWLSRSLPDDLTHFCRRMLGHAVADLAVNQDEGDSRAGSRRLHDELLPEAERLQRHEVWSKVEVPARSVTVTFHVHSFQDLGWVAVAEIGTHFVGAYSADDVARLNEWTLEIVDVPLATA